MKKRLIKLIALVMCAAMLTGCAASGGVKNLTDGVNAADVTLPEVTDYTMIGDLGAGLMQYAAAQEAENPVLSPLSAYLCLAMLMPGANENTKAEFKKILGADWQYVSALAANIASELTGVKGNTRLDIANSIWTDDDKAIIEEEWLRTVKTYFGPDIYSADLPSDGALKAINKWVNDKTNGMIPKLHDENYDKDTIMVLLNALYMKAEWAHKFEGQATYDREFTKADGSTVTVPFMNMFEAYESYIKTDGAEGIMLPYDDGRLAFIALKPDDGDARKYAAGFTGAKLKEALAAAKADTFVTVNMPKFDTEYSVYLTDALKAMGMTDAFDPDLADLTGAGRGVDGPLYISYVFQKVKVDVNEEGTEAAAVTEIATAEGCALPADEPIVMTFDKPFVYAIVDTETGVPLFAGVMENPEAK
ncbi:MAG: serpin family protein [Clostridiales bacterium]|nr:serpin family protein [Clostridiales bacterium]